MDKNRNLESKINDLLKIFPVVAILGPRQCGKSTIAKKVRPQWDYYDLEATDSWNLISRDMSSFFQIHSEHVIIDEAQQFPQLFNELRVVIDEKRKIKNRFIITGSSSPEIFKGITESLAGRCAVIELAPFKINEFCEKPLSLFYDFVNKKKLISEYRTLKSSCDLKAALHIWFHGGYPEPYFEHKDNVHFYSQWMDQYLSSYMNQDIRRLFPKLNLQNYRRFLLLLSQFSGHQINKSEIGRSLEINSVTVQDYLDIINDTFVWRNLPTFEKNLLKKIQKSHQGFFRDQGILHYLLKISSLDSLLLHPIAGFSFESFAKEEIIRGFQSTLSTQIDFSYYRSIDKSEVDLIVDGPFGFLPFKIKLSSSINSKSLIGLKNLMKDMKLKVGVVVNTAKTLELIDENIVQIPINYL